MNMYYVDKRFPAIAGKGPLASPAVRGAEPAGDGSVLPGGGEDDSNRGLLSNAAFMGNEGDGSHAGTTACARAGCRNQGGKGSSPTSSRRFPRAAVRRSCETIFQGGRVAAPGRFRLLHFCDSGEDFVREESAAPRHAYYVVWNARNNSGGFNRRVFERSAFRT